MSVIGVDESRHIMEGFLIFSTLRYHLIVKPTAHLDGKHVVFGELHSGVRVLDRMKSVELVEPKREGKPVSHQRVSALSATVGNKVPSVVMTSLDDTHDAHTIIVRPIGGHRMLRTAPR